MAKKKDPELNIADGQTEENSTTVVTEPKKEKKTKKEKDATPTVIDAKAALKITNKAVEKTFTNAFHAWLHEKEKLKQNRFSSGSIGLDCALGGEGLPEGRLTELWGPPSGGKTSLALDIAWHRQQQCLKRREKDISVGAAVIFVDQEHKFDRRLLDQWRGGFDPEWTIFEEPFNGEDAFGIMLQYAESAGTAIVILDSVTALRPTTVLAKQDQTTHYGVQAGLVSDWLPKLSGAAARTGVPMLMINQVRANVGAGQFAKGINQYTKGGGWSLKHWVAISMFLERFQDGFKKGTKDASGKYIKQDSIFKGHWSRATIMRNHSGKTFFNKFEMFLEHGLRFLTAAELHRMGIALGLIKQRGAWFDIGDQACQGEEAAVRYIDQNLETADKLWNEIREMQILGHGVVSEVDDLPEDEDEEEVMLNDE
jgi:recombination protein RecA